MYELVSSCGAGSGASSALSLETLLARALFLPEEVQKEYLVGESILSPRRPTL